MVQGIGHPEASVRRPAKKSCRIAGAVLRYTRQPHRWHSCAGQRPRLPLETGRIQVSNRETSSEGQMSPSQRKAHASSSR